MRCAICFAVLMAACTPHAVIANPLRVDVVALQREYERKHREALKRIDPDSLLDAPWEHASFKKAGLRGVLEQLSTNLGNRILIDDVALTDAAVDTMEVNIDLKDITTRKVLSEALRQSGALAKGIRVEVIDDLVVVSNDAHIAFLKRWFAPAVAAAVARHPERHPLMARIGAVSIDVCSDRTEFGLSVANVTLGEGLKQIAEEAHVRVEADWNSLTRCGIEGDADIKGMVDIPNVSIAPRWRCCFTTTRDSGPARLKSERERS